MEYELWSRKEFVNTVPFKVIEVIADQSQTSLVIQFGTNTNLLGLYRPEKGLGLSIDPRIPKPKELYLDCAFSEQCRLLGWTHVAPVFPWQLDAEDKGVIRPYWPVIKNMEIYHFNRQSLLKNDPKLWKKIAIADYVFGLADRVSNDFLVTKDGLIVIDSGFSFLPEIDFVYQHSLVRDNLRGESLSNDKDILIDLHHVPQNISQCQYLTDEQKFWVIERTQEILKQEMII